jgi:hypothetical protein
MGQNGRNRRDEQEWHSDRDRMFEDRSEGNRWGDHPQHDRNMQMQRDRFATGQSGYSAGRSGQDPALDYQNRNSGYARGMSEDRQVFGTDDRFTGRQGGGDYARERGRGGYDPERFGVPGGYAGGRSWEAERIGQRDSYGDRNYDQSFGSRERVDIRDDQGRGIYDHRDDNRSFQSRDYGPSESERGMWTTNTQRGDNRGQMDMRDGRTGQHRGKGPRGYIRSDERIKDSVCEALTDDSYIDASGIDVEVKNGEVTLSGMVPDRQTKRAAEDLVENLSGVKDVTNQLKISDDERQKLGRAQQSGNQPGNGVVQHDEPRKGDDKKARA